MRGIVQVNRIISSFQLKLTCQVFLNSAHTCTTVKDSTSSDHSVAIGDSNKSSLKGGGITGVRHLIFLDWTCQVEGSLRSLLRMLGGGFSWHVEHGMMSSSACSTGEATRTGSEAMLGRETI